MCGIAGWVERDPRQEVDRGLLERMTDLIRHRGPDAGGLFTEPGIGLGHRRLSIIDREGGRQPMTNEDGSVWIVFNGEIYNFQELRPELIQRGHRFATRSDTEVILHAYEEFGPDCLRRLRGMFAFAIWDRSKRQLLLARDRLGKKPLYYTRRDGALLFASEVKALLTVPGVTRGVNWEAIDPYLSLRYVPGPMTLFQDITKLMPGHYLLYKEGEVKVQSYWDVAFREEEDGRDDLQEEFEALLKESVRMRLMSEVPLGVFLSGGLDSSAIVAEMTQISKEGGWDRPIQTFSIGYDDPKANEFAYAREVAKHFGTDHHEFLLEGDAFHNFIPKMVWHLDEPMADPSCVPFFFISEYAKKSVTVVLSGEGADEILAGYGLYQKMRLIDQVQKKVPAWLLGGAARLLSTQRAARWRKYAEWIDRPLEDRYWGVSRVFTETAKRELLQHPDPGRSVAALFKEYYRKSAGLDPLNRMLYLDTKVWLPDQILLKADKMTMANSQELRVPFLDHKLVEFAATLPIHRKLSKGVGKRLLREAMAHRLPERILTRSKKGFPIPAVWFRKEVLPAARALFSERGSLIGEVMRKEKVAQMLAEEEAHPYTRHKEIWTLVILDYWHRIFIRQKGS
ncbi:MAG: asparagine synthase (glutamine-hydrolyzing) [Candidatus Manganitrophus sp. SA1]|nr:asparagine synthase (glutamine-hydrolyzing) [Candidatus Manganitrophus morganii]